MLGPYRLIMLTLIQHTRNCTFLWTELGSEMSAMKCSGCGNEEAIVLPVDGGDVDSEWRCNRCEARYSAKEMENICEECNDDLFATNSSNVQGPNSIETIWLEFWLEKPL